MMIHIEKWERDLAIDVAFPIWIVGLIQCEAYRGLRNHYDLERKLRVAWQVLERHIVEQVFFSLTIRRVLVAVLFVQFLKVNLLSDEVDVLTEQLRLRVAVFRDPDVSQEKCRLHLNEQRLKTTLIRLVSLLLFGNDLRICIRCLQFCVFLVQEKELPIFERRLRAVMVVALIGEVVTARLLILSPFIKLKVQHRLNAGVVVVCRLLGKHHEVCLSLLFSRLIVALLGLFLKVFDQI